MSTVKLTGVNELPSPTWNHLDINGHDVDVPYAPAGRADMAREAAFGLADGLGAEAAAWVRGAAKSKDAPVEVAAGETYDEVILPGKASDGSLAATSREFRLAAGAHADIAVVASGEASDESRTLASRLRLRLGQGATAHVHVLCALPGGQRYLDDLGVDLDDGAKVEVTYHLLGADDAHIGMDIEAHGRASACDVDVHYLAREHQVLDMNYVMRLRGQKSRAEFAAYGVLSGEAKKTLRDTIDLVRGCMGAKGHERETVLLADAGVTNKSLPVVLCDEADVEGTHGASIGAVSPEQLQFLMARGLSEKQVETLFARSVLDHAVAHAASAPERAAALAAAARTLGDEAAREMEEALAGAGEAIDE